MAVQEGSKNDVKKVKEGKLMDIKLKKEMMQDIIPQKVNVSRLWEKITSSSVKTIRCSNIHITYSPQLHNVSGSVFVNVFDNKYTDPKGQLLIHTAFPARSDQYIDICPNTVTSRGEAKDRLSVQIFTKDLNITDDTVFAHIKVRCNFTSSSKVMKSGPASLRGTPSLTYTRGSLLTANQLSVLTREHGFIGPPLVTGASYVIVDENAPSQIVSHSDLPKEDDKKYHDKPSFPEDTVVTF